ncbi:hypothetical protein HMN09_01007000 [Mycena chlorophos]|uniref:BRCT domain-containing protein n=1 Tax=Mycena chlorophos TaxID=658473 RepID=A0A8H6SFC1_MYCCL|nr:hypothetical protein HMN09_01007000 [Mycena chlorophos]
MANGPLPFEGVRYHLSSTLPRRDQDRLEGLLTSNGAQVAQSLADATHIISDSDTFEGWRDVENVPVVTELWVVHSVAAGKAHDPKYYSANPTIFFSGVVAASADLRAGDEDVIKSGILAHGGQWRMGLTKDVTHLFATSKDCEKAVLAMQHRDQGGDIRILAPEWFDRCVFLGAPVDTVPFEWPHPTFSDRSMPSDSQQLKRSQLLSMSPKKRALYRTAKEDDIGFVVDGPLDVWEGRKILLSSTLELSASRLTIVEKDIRKAGGNVVKRRSGTEDEDLINNCDVFITRHRAGVFFLAWKKKKTIGTLSWLLNVHMTRVLSSPLDQLLYFPHPENPVPGFDQHKISITNYAGDMRDYLKRLITLMGGTFTPGFGKSNTALIAAQNNGAKVQSAINFNVPVVNHIWLEDCFIQWKAVHLAAPKYVNYPSGIEISTLLGERGFGARVKETIDAEAAEVTESDQDEPLSQNGMEETEVDRLVAGGEDDVFLSEAQSPVDSVKARKLVRVDSDIEMEDGTPPRDRSRAQRVLQSQSQSPRLLRSAASAGPSTPTPSKSPQMLRSAATSPSKLSFSTPKSQSKHNAVDVDVDMEDVSPRRSSRNLASSSKSNDRFFSFTQDDDEPISPSRIVIKRTRLVPNGKGKGKAVESDDDDNRNSKIVISSPFKVSPRKKMPDLPVLQDDSDDELPDVPPLSAAHFSSGSKLAAGKAKANAAATTPKFQVRAAVRATTPPPPSSSIVASSPGRARMLDVLVPTYASLSAKKPSSARVVTLHQRRASASRAESASAPPRSSTATSRRGTSVDETSTTTGDVEDVPAFLPRSKRAAAARATQQLHDKVMPDVNKYQKEMRNNKRRVSARSEASTEYVDEESDVPSLKRRRKSRGSSPTADDYERPKRPERAIKLLTTKVELSDEVLKTLAQLGAKVTSKATECTHLITTGVVRTEKFLCALAYSPYILTEAWATESADAGELLPVENYFIRDEEGEERYNFVLKQALERAKTLKGTLFKDHTFYMTPGSFKNLDLIRNVILANGGQFVQVKKPNDRQLADQAHRHLFASEDERDLWIGLKKVTVYKSELVLAAAMRQELEWTKVEDDFILHQASV